MKRLSVWLVYCLWTLCLYAEIPSNYEIAPEITATEGLPSSLVNGSVCAISGEFTHSAIDIVIPGPEPLAVVRRYSNFSRGNFDAYWSWNHAGHMLLGDAIYKNNNVLIIGLRQQSSAQLDYQHPKEKNALKKEEVPFKLVVPKGFTNGAGRLSGQTSITNQRVVYYPHKKKTVVTDGAGTQRTFRYLDRLTEDGWSCFAQHKEEKINHALYDYTFDKETKTPSHIAVQHSQTHLSYSHFDLKTELAKQYMQLTASDGREVKYQVFKHDFKIKQRGPHNRNDSYIEQIYLKSVESDYAIPEFYDYKEKASSKELNLVSIKRKDRLVTQIDYYHEGSNRLNEKIGSISLDKDDPRLDRVRRLKAPVGIDGSLITTHSFDYHYRDREKEGRKQILNGYTNVYDAYDCRTKYTYDANHRLVSITRYTKGDKEQRYSKERFIWGEGNQEGNLICKIFEDGAGNPYRAHCFEYDDYGNVVQSALYGKLTGLSAAPLQLDGNQMPLKNGCEAEYKAYSYSQDGLNLLLSETHSNGIKIEYDYVIGTNYIAAKRTCYDGQIQLREFYLYDQDDMLIQKIHDNGHGYDKNDLTGVTERHFVYIKPRKKRPVGLPEEIEERYLENGQEKVLNRVKMEYTRHGLLEEKEVYHSNNQKSSYTLTWKYDAHGNVIEETDALGNSITKEYDAYDNLVYQRASYADFYLKYTYDFANRLIRQEEIHDDGQCFVTRHQYNYLGQCEVTTNAYGHETKQEFDEFGRVKTILYPAVLNEQRELKHNEQRKLMHPVIAKAYDIAGYPTCVMDAKEERTHIEYNIHGKPVKILYPDGTAEGFIYRIDGPLMHKIAKDGTAILYQRDPQGRITEEIYYNNEGIKLKEIKHTYDALHLTETTDAAGSTTTYHYDAAGRLESTSQENRRKQYFYDEMGRVHEEREWFGEHPHEYRSTIKEYDLVDRVTDEKLQTSEGVLLEFAHYEYDAYGNRTLEQKGEQITVTTYNSHKQPTSITNGLGQTTHITYDTKFINADGQCVLKTITTDPLGYQTIDTYDTANRLVEITRCDPLGVCLSCQKKFYDFCGNVYCVEDHIMEKGKSQRKIETYFEYDKVHQIKKLTEAAGTHKQKITRTEYNAYGQKFKVEKPNGVILEHTYDTMGRLKTLKSSDGSIAYTYTYDERHDQVTAVLDERTGLATKREYDFLGQLKTEVLGHGLALQYTYDPIGRVRQVTLPDQTQVEYQYDAAHLKSIHRHKAEKNLYAYHKTAYNLNGQATQIQLPGKNGYLEAQYDALGRCISLKSATFQQQIPLQGGYDAAGNLRQLETQGVKYTFDYDDLYQIKTETGHVHHAYGFDSLSNRLTKDGEEHTYNDLHQLERKGQEIFDYDTNGNLKLHIKAGKTTQYAYDVLDRLIAVTKEGMTVGYYYDGFNRRLIKHQHGQEPEWYVYQGQEEVGNWKQGKFQELRLMDHTRRSPMLAIELKNKLYVPLYDISGNVACLMDEQGQVVERYRYTVFGETEILTPEGQLIPTSAVHNPWQYAGKRLDLETGFIAFGLRYYDPQVGRWITADPAGLADGPNLYAYVHNSPLRYCDQFGLFSVVAAPNFAFNQPCNDYDSPALAGGFNSDVFSLVRGLVGSFLSNQCVNFLPFEKFLGSHRSLEDHCNHFELEDYLLPNACNFEHSGIYSLNEMNLINPETNTPYHFPDKPGLLYMGSNGIMNNYQDFQNNLLHMAQLADRNFVGIHAASYGFAWDGVRFIAARLGIATEAVQLIHKVWNNFFLAYPNGHVFFETHSRGVADLRNALLSYPPHLRERITVLAIAPGQFIEQDLCESVLHLISRDIVPYFDPVGMFKNRATIEFVPPSPSASWVDHTCTSPSYIRKSQDYYNRFQGRYE